MRTRVFVGCVVAVAVTLVACGAPDTPEADPGTDTSPPAPATTAPSTAPVDTTAVDTTPVDTGPTTTAPEPDPPPTTGSWEVVRIGDRPGEGGLAMAEHDGRLWVVRAANDGTTLVVSSPDGDQETEFDVGGFVVGVGLASTPFGLVLTASAGDDYRPHAWVSPDGTTWTASVIVDRPVDVTGLTWTGTRLLAAGAERPPVDPGAGPFQPALFATTDGIDWREIELGVDRIDSWLAPVVVDGDRLVSSVRIPSGDWRVPATLESRDDGETWQRLGDENLAPESIGRAGGTLFGVNGGAADSPDEPWIPLLADTGEGWATVDLEATIGPHTFALANLLTDGPFGLISVQFDRPIEYCFDDPERCRPQTVVVRVVEGSASLVDLGALDIGWDVTAATTSGAGDVSLLYANDDGLFVATWPASAGDLPTAPAIVLPEPTGPPVIEWGAEIEVGAVYRYALYTHCGIEVLGTFGGRNWWIQGVPTAAYDPSEEGLGSLLGEIHVVADDRIEYVLDDELIAVFTPQDREIPGCE